MSKPVCKYLIDFGFNLCMGYFQCMMHFNYLGIFLKLKVLVVFPMYLFYSTNIVLNFYYHGYSVDS